MTTFSSDGSIVDPATGEHAGTPADVPTPTNDDVFNEPDPALRPPEVHTETVVATAEPEPPAATAELATVTAAGPLAVAQQNWTHDYLMFAGDKLEVRLPSEQALTAFSLACGKYIPMEVQNDMVSMFINKHLSEDSYAEVMAKMMDPDDTTYNVSSVGELMGAIVTAAVESRKAAKEAAAAEAKALAAKK